MSGAFNDEYYAGEEEGLEGMMDGVNEEIKDEGYTGDWGAEDEAAWFDQQQEWGEEEEVAPETKSKKKKKGKKDQVDLGEYLDK